MAKIQRDYGAVQPEKCVVLLYAGLVPSVNLTVRNSSMCQTEAVYYTMKCTFHCIQPLNMQGVDTSPA